LHRNHTICEDFEDVKAIVKEFSRVDEALLRKVDFYDGLCGLLD